MTINAKPNAPFEATLAGAPAGVARSARVVDGPTQRVLVDVTPAIEFPATFFTATMTAPDEQGQFAIVWDNGAAEDLFVSARVVDGVALPELVATYASAQDVRDFTLNADVLALDDDELTKLIAASESDVDRAVGFVQSDTQRRFTPSSLTQDNRTTLARATAAQVEYRVVMGDDFFTRAQYASVNGPEFSTTGTLPRIGPRVYDELAGSDLLQLTTTWTGKRAPSWYSFAYNAGDDQ